MKRSSGRPYSKELSEKDGSQDLPESLSLSSDSEPASEEEDSDLPEETDSEAGLPSDDLDSEAEEGSSDASSDKDELDQAFLNVLENDDTSRPETSLQSIDRSLLATLPP